MARPVTTKVKKFSLAESEVVEENERILSQKTEQKTEQHTPAAKVETATHDTAPQQSDVVQPQTTAQTAPSTPQSISVTPEAAPQQSAPTTQTSSTPAPQSVVTAPETTPQQSAPTVQTSAAPADSPATDGLEELAAMRKPKGKKTENGITVYVPMEYYERIALMKMRTGIPIRDLALQAVIEFIDRNMA